MFLPVVPDVLPRLTPEPELNRSLGGTEVTLAQEVDLSLDGVNFYPSSRFSPHGGIVVLSGGTLCGSGIVGLHFAALVKAGQKGGVAVAFHRVAEPAGQLSRVLACRDGGVRLRRGLSDVLSW